MGFDNYVVGAICHELKNLLLGGRIERIYQPGPEELILCIRRFNLLISAGASRPLIYLADSREAGPGNPPAFCMLLRKYLIGARFENIEQAPRERILRFDFRTSNELGLNEEKSLIFELM